MKKNMTAGEAIALNNAVFYAMNNLKAAPVRLGLRLAYNSKQLEPVVSAFEDARKKALETYVERTELGEMKVEDGQFVLTDKTAFEAALKEASDEHFDIEFKELTSDIFPETIDAAIIGGLYPIIVEVEQKESA